MNKKLQIFSVGLFCSCLLALPVAIGAQEVAMAKGEDVDPNSVTLVQAIKAVHDNNISDITSNALFDYGVRHGSLNSGDKSGRAPGCYVFDAKDGESDKYLYSTNAADSAYIDWGGEQLHSLNNDRVIFKIVAKKDVELVISKTSDAAFGGWDDPVFDYYKSSTYNEASGDWIGNGAVIEEGMSKTSANLFRTIYLNQGETFYFQWGFEYGGDMRNIQLNNADFKFTLRECSVDYLPISQMISSFCSSHGAPVEGKNVQYAFAHGDIRNGEAGMQQFAAIGNNALGQPDDTCYAQNWKIISGRGDGLAVVFHVEKYSTLKVSRPLAGTDWTADAKILVYNEDTEIMTKTLTGSPSDFDFEYTMKVGDTIIWEFIFEWGDEGQPDTWRNIAMSNAAGADIAQTMPLFEIKTAKHTHSWTEVPEVPATCENPGCKKYYSCSCGLYAEDNAGANLIGDKIDLEAWKEDDEGGLIPMVDHQYGVIQYAWADDFSLCTAYRECATCECKLVIQEVAGVYQKDTDATCTVNEKGHFEAHFTAVDTEDQATPANSYEVPNSAGHVLGDVQYAWADDFSTCTAFKKCSRCEEDIIIETVEGVYQKDTDATHFANEKGHFEAHFTAVDTEDQATPANSYEVPNSKVPHSFGTPEYTWSDDNKSCTASRVCECGEIDSETVAVVEEDGKYVARFTNPAFETQRKDMPKPAKGGCGGSVIATSVVLSSIALIGIASVVLAKKKREE